MTHATVGLVFGAGAGVLFALRRRGARALDGAAKSFYPTRSGAAVVPKVSGAEAPPVDEIANRARTFAKAVGLGFIGGVAGYVWLSVRIEAGADGFGGTGCSWELSRGLERGSARSRRDRGRMRGSMRRC